jgi:hypothetical protein
LAAEISPGNAVAPQGGGIAVFASQTHKHKKIRILLTTLQINDFTFRRN